jgi:hypothetical protein
MADKPAAITMYHPQSERTQRASRDAFDAVWSTEGWEIVETPAEPKATRGRKPKADAGEE